MNPAGGIDRALGAWFEADSVDREPAGLLDGVLRETRRTRRRPAILVRPAWSEFPAPHPQLGLVAATLLVAALLLTAAAAVALGIGALTFPPAPGGARGVIVASLGGDLRLLAADGSVVRELTREGSDTKGAWLDQGPVWSPDGERVAFWRQHGF